ncbi:MAG: hypothetical protein Kow0069_00250 [Promethearchaeota archaeon]
MRVVAKFKTQLATLAGVPEVSVEVPDGSTLLQFVRALEEKLSSVGRHVPLLEGSNAGAEAAMASGVLMLLNDRDVRVFGSLPGVLSSTILKEGDEVTFLSFLHGG